MYNEWSIVSGIFNREDIPTLSQEQVKQLLVSVSTKEGYKHVTIYCNVTLAAKPYALIVNHNINIHTRSMFVLYYRVIALISVNIVPSWDIEGRELASVRRYPNEGQYSPISVQ